MSAITGTLTITSVAAPGAAFAGPADRGVATMELIDGDAPPTTGSIPPASRGPASPGPETAVMRRLDDEVPPDDSVPPHQDTPGPVGETWTIQPGDHLWHVAETTLADSWGHPPSNAETATYLGELIRANLSELVVPDNPDLVFVGQAFSLPTPAMPEVGP